MKYLTVFTKTSRLFKLKLTFNFSAMELEDIPESMSLESLPYIYHERLGSIPVCKIDLINYIAIYSFIGNMHVFSLAGPV